MDSSEKTYRTEPKIPLVTPSASPPRSRQYSSQPHRIPDQASPTKRPRLLSAPRQMQQCASSSSSTPADGFDFYRAREESAMRLLDVWSGLAERYSRPLDEDDIVDVMTGKVVKDRGVLRGLQTCTVGAFADPAQEDAEDDLEEDEEEDDNDALDSFANPAMRGMDAPSLVDLDARDAQDLKEFMEAEQRRSEIYGSEADESEGSVYGSQLGETLMDESGRDASHEGPKGDRTSDHPPEPIYVDSGSEDELGGWDLQEASVVYRLRKEEDSDSETEILNNVTQPRQPSPEIPLPSWTSPETLPRRLSNQRQLQTPPASDPSATPDDFSDHPLPTSPPRSSSPLSQYDSSPIKSRLVAPESKKPVCGRKRTIASQARSKPVSPIPRLDMTKVSAETLVKCKLPSKTMSLHSANRAKGKSKQHASDVDVSNRQRAPSRAPSQRRNDAKGDKIEWKPRHTSKAKEKQRVPSAEERSESSEEDSPRRPSPPLGSKSGSARSRSLRPSVSSTSSTSQAAGPLLDDVGLSPRKPKLIPLARRPTSIPGRKRKRVVSSAETVEETRTSYLGPPTEDNQKNSSTSRSRRRSSSASDIPEIAKESNLVRKEKRKHNPRRRSLSVGSESDDASQEEKIEQFQRYSSHALSHLNVPYHSYLPPHHPSDQQPMYTPLQDPHVQYIFNQAMQQIFALGSGLWPPIPPPACDSTPFTPKHDRHYRIDTPPPSSMYSTPMHRPHPYSYYYNPMLSNATLPPSSPEVPSSPPGTSFGGGQPRRKSLVKRGQSRGRRVSFREEESDIDALGATEAYSDGASSPTRRQASGSGPKERRKKGKERARDEHWKSDSETESGPSVEPHISKPGRPRTRHQTPGPSSREQGPTRDIRKVPSAYRGWSKSRA